MENNLERSIVKYLKDNEGASSIDIAERFLKFKSPNEQIACVPVTAVLKGIRGVLKRDDGLWFFNPDITIKNNDRLKYQPWSMISVLMTNENKPMCIGVSYMENIDENDVFWLMDPAELDEDFQSVLRSGRDQEFKSPGESVEKLYAKIKDRIIICSSFKEQGMLARVLGQCFYSLPDDTYLLNNFIKVLDIKKGEPSDLYKQFYGESPINNSAGEINRTFGFVIRYLIEMLESKGVNNIDDFTSIEVKKALLANWKHLNKNVSDILNADKSPGVYGFTGKDGKYIYIGKAKNIQKRLLSYFRISEESPEKLNQLRENAYHLTIHQCGSELESLLNEQRLIVKYQPLLNRKVSINERAGEFNYLDDSIIILPHSEKSKILTIWLRKEQKIRVVSLSKNDLNNKLVDELNNFFYCERLKPESTDFQELEIVNRWVRQNREGLDIIAVNRFKDSLELFKQICAEFESYFKQLL